MLFIEILKSVLFGIVEGITEWLPVSSTGHLILLGEFLSLDTAPELGATFAAEYSSMFEVVIQLGAILAVAVIYFQKLMKKNLMIPFKAENMSVLGQEIPLLALPEEKLLTNEGKTEKARKL